MHNLIGGSQKTETMFAEIFLTATTAVNFTKTEGSQNYFADPAKKSSSELGNAMLCSSGKNLSTHQVSKESTAPFLETNQSTAQVPLSDRLTPLLISAGLVKGTIPMSMRDASGQTTLDAVLRPLDGDAAASPKAVS
jgi:hypothetical protein